MNISQPIASSISGVTFSVLPPEEVRRLSVKQITTSLTLDNLLNPVPGGLWDPAFGAVIDNPCSTCRLDSRACPGHCGHIELPAKVFHVTFLDQAYRLLRAQCQFCYKFRMSRQDCSLYWCKLKLIRHGLLEFVDQVEDVGLRRARKVGNQVVEDAENSDDSDNENDTIIGQRKAFVKRCLKDAIRDGRDLRHVQQTEAIVAARKAVVTQFKAEILTPPKCRNCNMYSPLYRKNRATAVFLRALTSKQRAQNAQASNSKSRIPNALAEFNKQMERDRRRAKKSERALVAEQIDEGVADLESSLSDDVDDTGLLDDGHESSLNEEEDVEMQTAEAGQGSLLQTESSMSGTQKRKRTDGPPSSQRLVNANEAYAYLQLLFQRESEILRLIYQPLLEDSEPSCDMFFVQNLLVPPSKYRKEMRTTRGEVAEPPDHASYKEILQKCEEISDIYREIQGQAQNERGRQRNYDDLLRSSLNLQDFVNSLFDREKSTVRGLAALRIPDGIKQKLEKKEGLFRMNIMGKRVNFAARSVISPDPNIETNEIGVPPVFAKTLTYPEPVTSFSFDYLKQAVINGPRKWPGAAAVESENGQVISLRNKSEDERLAIANMLLAPSSNGMTGNRNKKVHRHLNNGDMVIMNRQPTLHKPSMMCHRARILPGEKTIRMHYANCNTYNADFDGDEMNMHFPQNEYARAEALEIADTDHQYLSATAGKPLRGLIQDHISMSTWLTCIDMFFTREEYLQLLYSSIRPEHNHTENDRILTVDPCIIKPRPRWTGKQLITTVLKNIRPQSHANIYMESACSIPAGRWGEQSEEGRVRIVDGELLTGLLDKKQIGPSSGGLFHCVYEAYGHIAAGRLISILGRLLTRMLNMRAFSCGIQDLLLTDKGNAIRSEKLAGSKTVGVEVASKYVSLDVSSSSSQSSELTTRLESVLRDDEKQANLDLLTNSASSKLTSSIWAECLPSGLAKPFPKNQMQTMTTSGAKGSSVNANHISCNLGQQVLEGRRVPVMVSGKTLPSFRPFETSIRAGGYITDRFLTGVRPQEYYFQLMAGREGLIDTAVKTSRSGYLQRCLVKGLEGLRASHDSSVRDSDGSIVQALYGEDALEIIKQQKLMDFRFLSQNFLSLFSSLNVKEDASMMIDEQVIELNREALRAVSKSGDIAASDPVLSIYPPFSIAGSTSEKYSQAVKAYISKNPDKTIASKGNKGNGLIPKDIFRRMLLLNYLKSVVEPGEAVGVVAAQSIGEPSTQMTLNTFHLAGFAAKNVTLGIPRLREILMTASRAIKKPTMTLYPHEELSKEACSSFAKSISRLPLSQVVDETSVEESVRNSQLGDTRVYKVRLNFFPSEEYTKEYAITVRDVADIIERSFSRQLCRLIRKEIKKRQAEKSDKIVTDAQPEIGRGRRPAEDEAPAVSANRPNRGPRQGGAEDAGPDNEGGDSDDEDGGDDDAGNAKRKAQLNEGMTYEDPDESEAEIERQGERDAEDGADDSSSDHEDEGYGSGNSQPKTQSQSQSQIQKSNNFNDPTNADSSGSEDEPTSPPSPSSPKATQQMTARAERVTTANKEITSFTFPEKSGTHCELELSYPTSAPKILLLNIVNSAAHTTLIQQIPNLNQAQLTTTDDTPETAERIILTEGSNLSAMRLFQHILNPHKLSTNDIGAMLDLYGVEAARNLIIAETSSVFKSHNIDVDIRHLTLVADYMTRDGGYLPFSRNGMRDKSSPFAKMSFETTVGFLGSAVMDGEVDDLTSPSARIVVGRVGNVGSGMSGIVVPISSSGIGGTGDGIPSSGVASQ